MSMRIHSVALAAALLAAGAASADVVRIAHIDPFSGPAAAIVENANKTLRMVAEIAAKEKWAGGHTFEIVNFDGKGSPQESLQQLKNVADQGFRYVAHAHSSAVAAALIDAVNRHNERNPGKEVIFLNDAAVDPDFTNSKCSYWHFRFDADTSMKIEAMTTFMKDDQSIKKVYLFNQNYSHGHQVAKFAKENLARKRPDVQIVGEDLHPLAQVRDFSPYIAKIKASGADTVITGNWGSDLALLVKAANEGGYTGKFYTYYTGVTGTPTALGQGGAGRVYQIAYSHYNMGGDMGKWMAEFKTKFNDDFYTGSVISIFGALGEAMAKAKSTEPAKVAAAMEGLKYKSYHGEVEIRKADHQLQQPLYMTVWQKADKKYPYSPENTGMTLAPVKEFPSYVSSTPTSCQMKRPG